MCSRVWSAGVERRKSVEGGRTFMECQEHPFHKGRLPVARDSDLPVGTNQLPMVDSGHRSYPRMSARFFDPKREGQSFWIFTTP